MGLASLLRIVLWGTIKELEKQSGVFASEAEVDDEQGDCCLDPAQTIFA